MLVILCCLCYRRRRKPSTVSNDSEPETARLPRGGEKTYDDVLATRYRRASLDSEEGGGGRRSAAGSRSQRSRRSPDRARDRGRDRDDDDYEYARSARDDRSDWRDSYDYDYERRARAATPAVRVAGAPRRKGDAYQPSGSGSNISSGRESVYSGRSELPPLPSYPDRLVVSRTGSSDRDREYGQRPRTPRSADPFSSEYDSEPPSSPKRYLYPEVVTMGENKEEKGKKKDEEMVEEPQPKNFLPVFSAPKFTQLPGTNAIVELI